jgi:hypothetical protein
MFDDLFRTYQPVNLELPAMPASSTISSHRCSLTPIAAALLAVLTLAPGAASAAPFTINGNSNTARTLAAGETGTVDTTGKLAVSGSTVAVAVTGSNATLNNQGIIEQTGSGRAVRANAAVQELIINNGSAGNAAALIRSADADVIQMNLAASSVTLNNYGTLVSLNASAGGAQAVDFNALTGTGTVNNFAGALVVAYEADAIRTGANGVVVNAGTIRSVTLAGSSSDAIDGQANSGLRVTNSGLIDGGRHGITFEQKDAATASTLDFTNLAGGVLSGNSGSGINVDGFNGLQLVTVANAGTISGNGVTGDGDGIDVDGLVHVTNTGIVRSLNAVEAGGMAFSEGISAGGGTIINSGTIEGLVAAGNSGAVGRGITLAGNDIASGPLAGTREGLYGNALIVNQSGGLVRGQGDSAIYVTGAASGYTVTVDNRAGAAIRGGGATTAAIQGGADNTFITNAGTIDGSSSGRAIQLGAGNDSVTISGASAVINGAIDGGAGTNTFIVDAGAGNAFGYSGVISRFASVEIRSGSLALTGAERIAADTALVLAGGTLDLRDAASQTFASLALGGSSSIVLGNASLTFNGIGAIAAGATLTVTDDLGTPGYAFRFLGNYSADAGFQQLLAVTTVDTHAVTYSFDGIYTNVSAVPEPGSIAMMLGGLGILAAAARRQRKPD